MNATLERLTDEFVQLIGPAAFAASTVAPAKPAADSAVPAAPTAAAGTSPGAASGSADARRAGLRPALPVTAPAPVLGSTPAPKPAAPSAPPPPPPSPVQVVDHALKGFHFDATVSPDQVVAAAKILDRAGFGIDAVTGVDWLAQSQMEVVYDYFHPLEGLRAVVRTRVNRAEPELATISTVFPGANWHERETHDFFGIRFTGHPNLKPFLLPEDANFHPLRKDYQP